MPEYLKNRYKSSAIRWIMTLVALISYVFTKISVSCKYIKRKFHDLLTLLTSTEKTVDSSRISTHTFENTSSRSWFKWAHTVPSDLIAQLSSGLVFPKVRVQIPLKFFCWHYSYFSEDYFSYIYIYSRYIYECQNSGIFLQYFFL